MHKLVVIAVLAAGTALTAPARASEALPASLAERLDGQPAEFTMSAAKERRLMIMQETMRQQQYGRRGGYGRGPGYGPGPGYGRGPGYGPRSGYGPPGYGPRPYGPPPGYYRY